MVPLVAGRPFGVLLGWDVRHPFKLRPSYEAIADLPLEERLKELARPEVREAILSEAPGGGDEVAAATQVGLGMILPMTFTPAF